MYCERELSLLVFYELIWAENRKLFYELIRVSAVLKIKDYPLIESLEPKTPTLQKPTSCVWFSASPRLRASVSATAASFKRVYLPCFKQPAWSLNNNFLWEPRPMFWSFKTSTTTRLRATLILNEEATCVVCWVETVLYKHVEKSPFWRRTLWFDHLRLRVDHLRLRFDHLRLRVDYSLP